MNQEEHKQLKEIIEKQEQRIQELESTVNSLIEAQEIFNERLNSLEKKKEETDLLVDMLNKPLTDDELGENKEEMSTRINSIDDKMQQHQQSLNEQKVNIEELGKDQEEFKEDVTQ